ncbi:alpha/beta hydrolase family esterase [Roseivivax lentus]|nr:PHB depolymerase family esterase [Roseivivax lentus]
MLLALSLLTAGTTASAWQKTEVSMRIGSMNRTATVYLPDVPSARDRWPVVMVLHPGFATGEDMARISRLHLQPGSENFVFVYPDGFRRSWNARECCGRAQARNIDDVGFLTRLADQIGTMVPTQSKMFVAGYSNGALMAYRLACDVPERLAAFSVYAGAPRLSTSTCSPARSVPLLHLHGELDAVAPLEGGESSIASAGTRVSVLNNIQWWSQMNGCARSQPSNFISRAQCTEYSGCRNGSQTLFCIYPGQGHYWPGSEASGFGERRGLGPARSDLNGGQHMIRFFEKYR